MVEGSAPAAGTGDWMGVKIFGRSATAHLRVRLSGLALSSTVLMPPTIKVSGMNCQSHFQESLRLRLAHVLFDEHERAASFVASLLLTLTFAFSSVYATTLQVLALCPTLRSGRTAPSRCENGGATPPEIVPFRPAKKGPQ
jgi:hypothetical protein